MDTATRQSQVITVGTYADRLNAALSRTGAAIVEGEVQEVRQMRSGVLGFALTDGTAKLPCRYLPWMAGHRPLTHTPEAGDQVRVCVRHAEWFAQGGTANVIVTDVELAGEGELLRARANVLAKLGAEGLCDQSLFPELPRFPAAVGVIAGHGSDAYHDVLQGLRDRFPAVSVVGCCCRVQGAGAPEQLIAALATLDAHPQVEVIIIARGGGSVQDLAAFDHEGLCRAIRAIDTPVVTAIGHTQNNPVCNHITHAAFVPRHAAERVVCDRSELLRDVDAGSEAMGRAIRDLRRTGQEVALACSNIRGSGRVFTMRNQVRACGEVIERRAHAYVVDGNELLECAGLALTRASGRLQAHALLGGEATDGFAAAAARASELPRRTRVALREDAEALGRALARALERRRQQSEREFDSLAAARAKAAARVLAAARTTLDRDADGLARARGHTERERARVQERASSLGLAARRIAAARRSNMLRALDRMAANHERAAARLEQGWREEVARETSMLGRGASRRREQGQREVAALLAVLDAADFRRRGWLLATGADGHTVTKLADVHRHDRVQLHLLDGDADAVIGHIHPNETEA